MMKFTVGDGQGNITVTLFDATEKLIGSPISEYIEEQKKEGLYKKFYKGMIYRFGESYIFLIRINQMNDKERFVSKLIAHDVCKFEPTASSHISFEDNSTIKTN